MAVTTENLKAFGLAVRQAREQKGIKTLVELERQTGISQQRLSQLESGRVDAGRRPSIPSDSSIEKLAAALDVPVARMHALLGRGVEQATHIFTCPETALMAEEYDALPDFARQIVRDVIESVKKAGQAHNG